MTARIEFLQQYLQDNLHNKINAADITEAGGLTLDIPADNWLEVANFLRRDAITRFEQLIDLCGVDYLNYGQSEWEVTTATSAGFSRAVSREPDLFDFGEEEQVEFEGPRYAVVAHLLSVSKNTRIRLRTRCENNDFPVVPSLINIWSSANWYEREAFDLFGIMFNNHPDLRRILTDYGFVGHPFRKDFPLSGHVEMRYDPEKQRVVYEPVSIEPRTLVPRVIRKDERFSPAEELDD